MNAMNIVFCIMVIFTLDAWMFLFNGRDKRQPTLKHYISVLKMPMYQKQLVFKVGIVMIFMMFSSILKG
jgi:hypothetical protein